MKKTDTTEEVAQADRQDQDGQGQNQPVDDSSAAILTLTQQADEWKNKYLRVLADYQNLERRIREKQAEDYLYATEKVLKGLLPITDSLARAQVHLQDQGLVLVVKATMNFLGEHGVERIETVDRDFDPYLMECIQVVEGKTGKVVEELEAGYTLRGKLLRAAKVKVGKDNVKSANAQSTNE